MVAITYDAPAYGVSDAFTCGAEQLTGYFFVLAAHCVTDFPYAADLTARSQLRNRFSLDSAAADIPTSAKSFSARIGSPNRTAGGLVVPVSVVWVHPGWSWGQGPEGDDVALLKSSTYVDGYALPLAPRAARPGDTVYELGWGSTEPDGTGPVTTMINELRTTILPSSACAPGGITTREVCTNNPNGTSGPCYGDSGGPLIIKIDGVLYTAGITSHGASQYCGDTPGIYTSSPQFRAELYAVMLGSGTTAHGAPVR
jgi:hypothetical protein